MAQKTGPKFVGIWGLTIPASFAFQRLFRQVSERLRELHELRASLSLHFCVPVRTSPPIPASVLTLPQSTRRLQPRSEMLPECSALAPQESRPRNQADVSDVRCSQVAPLKKKRSKARQRSIYGQSTPPPSPASPVASDARDRSRTRRRTTPRRPSGAPATSKKRS